MIPKTEMLPWIAQDERTLVRYADLAHLIAQAKHPQAEDAATYERERLLQQTVLRQDVHDGLLRVRPERGLARILNSPTDAELAVAVLLPQEDLQPYLEARGIELRLTSQGIWQRPSTLKEVAAFIQKEQGWNATQATKFVLRLEQAVRDGEIACSDSRTHGTTNGQPTRNKNPTAGQLNRMRCEQVIPMDVNRWLARQGETFRWNSPLLPPPERPRPRAADAGGSIRPVPRALAQEETILQAIHDDGLDPKALPRQPGKSGVKALIRAKLQKNKLFVGATIFDRAWERLRHRGDIADAKGTS